MVEKMPFCLLEYFIYMYMKDALKHWMSQMML